MKKFTLIVALFAFVFSAKVASAQTFAIDHDTMKGYWSAATYPIEMTNYASTTSSSPITITWKVVDFQKAPKWEFDGFCDNLVCRYEKTPGLLNGDSSFTTLPFSSSSAKAMRYFKVDFLADDADNGTKSSITVQMTSGTTTENMTFIGYKGATGISTTVLQDNDIAIFPNPASNFIDVAYSPSSDVKTIAIYNLIGKVVNVFKVTDKSSAHCQFSADMPSGIYIVRVADSKGNVIATRKITHQ